jgi:hypothetical protein
MKEMHGAEKRSIPLAYFTRRLFGWQSLREQLCRIFFEKAFARISRRLFASCAATTCARQ